MHENRRAEGDVLLGGWEDRLEAAQAGAKLHDARDELDLAVSVLRWALREQETNLVASAPLWAQLVDVECRRDVAAADEAASRLESIAASLASPGIRALARLSRGRVQTAGGEDAVATLLAALRELGEDERPRLRAQIHIALPEAEQSRDV